MLTFKGQAGALDVKEHRNEPRTIILARANIEIPGILALTGHAVDVSRNGMGLQCSTEISPGQELRVTVPLCVGGEERMVELWGRVSYCKRQTERHFRIGLQFAELDEATTEFINALCP